MSETIPYVSVADVFEAPGVPPETPTIHVPFSKQKVASAVRAMPFRIVAANPTSSPQMHSLSCLLEDGTPFSIEPRKFRELGQGDMIEVVALLSVPAPIFGARLSKRFAACFGVPPPAAGPPGTPHPIAVSLIRTGTQVTRFGNGSFSRRSGSWTSTKMTLDDRDLEVYLNFNLDQGVGELSEKRPSHDPGIAELLMRVLHDGKPPQVPAERVGGTPAATDPVMARINAMVGQLAQASEVLAEITRAKAAPNTATSSNEPTPYALARKLRDEGASDEVIAQALRARGLDAQEVRILLNAT